jgi:hypothetical protein
VVVGARAVYLHTGTAELAVAEFTTDADLAIDPAGLNADPRLDAALGARGFTPDLAQPGIYWSTSTQSSSTPTGPASRLVERAVAGLENPATIRASTCALAEDLLAAIA